MDYTYNRWFNIMLPWWQTYEVIFLSNEVIFLSNEVIFLWNEVIFLSNEVIFLSNEVILISNEVIFLSNEVIFLSNEVIFLSFQKFVSALLAAHCTLYLGQWRTGNDGYVNKDDRAERVQDFHVSIRLQTLNACRSNQSWFF